MGDTLISLPAFWAIKKSLPDAKITLLSNINPKNPQFVLAQSVLPEKGLFDNWLNYPTGLNKYETLQMFKNLFLEIRRSKFDALFYLMNRSRSLKQIKRDEVFFKVAGIREIFGMNYLKKNILSFSESPPLPQVESEGLYLLKCLANDNFPIPPKGELKPELMLSNKESDFAKNWLKQKVGEDFKNKKLIGVGPSSKWESKIWKQEKFSRVVKSLIEKKDVFPIIFGGAEDKAKGNRLIEGWKKGANAAGNLNIRQAAAALKRCKFYFGNDTGTMHLAAAVDIPCVCIFAAIDYEGRWYPFGSQHKIFRKKVECEGCHTPNCFNQNKCLELIEEENVLQACLEILDNV